MADDSSTRSWDAIADDWIAHADANDYRNFYLMPRMLAMLGDVRGRSILDLGCGEGGYARELAKRGAAVSGVDGSARLVEVARERSSPDIAFIHANANALDALAPESFDLVVAAMSLMDVEDYEGAIREAHRVLKAGGELVMSITHPCFSTPASRWRRSADGSLVVYEVDRYLDRVAWESPITDRFRTPVLRRHRPLEDYMAAPMAAGFSLREFVEPGVTDEELAQSRRFRKLERVPYFLFLRWKK